jgi:8-oxo-dGTP pyrophosphatase MutT (NUDIX family)
MTVHQFLGEEPLAIQRYVAGFLFDDLKLSVALILKQFGPPILIGKWNAIGGKCEGNELPMQAITREFQEEAGVYVPNWEQFLILRGADWEVNFYHAFSTILLRQVHTCEVERVWVHLLHALPATVPNLQWMIPMALHHREDHVAVYEVIEKVTTPFLA